MALATWDVHVTATPTKGARISAVNGNDGTNLTCPVVVVLPPNFTTSGLLVASFSGEGTVVSDYPDLAVTTCELLNRTVQAIYPGPGPHPCISNAASHQGGASAAAYIEVLAGIGNAYLVSSAANAPGWTAGRCNR